MIDSMIIPVMLMRKWKFRVVTQFDNGNLAAGKWQRGNLNLVQLTPKPLHLTRILMVTEKQWIHPVIQDNVTPAELPGTPRVWVSLASCLRPKSPSWCQTSMVWSRRRQACRTVQWRHQYFCEGERLGLLLGSYIKSHKNMPSWGFLIRTVTQAIC